MSHPANPTIRNVSLVDGVATFDFRAFDLDADTLQDLDAWIEEIHYEEGDPDVLGFSHGSARPAWLTADIDSQAVDGGNVNRAAVSVTVDDSSLASDVTFVVIGLRISDGKQSTDTHFRYYRPLAAVAAYVPGVVLWKFDEGEGQVILDHSGNDYDGRLGASADNTTGDPDWDTRGVATNETDGYCTAAQHISNLWAPGDTFSLVYGTRVAKGPGFSNNAHICGCESGTTNRWQLVRQTGTDNLQLVSGVTILATVTDFFADALDDVVIGLTISGTSAKFYRDGQLVATETIGARSAQSGTFWLFRKAGLAVDHDFGEAHHFSFHHAALTDQEHSQQYDAFRAAVAPRGVIYGPQHAAYTYFRLTITDVSDSNFTGTRELELYETYGGSNALTAASKTITSSAEADPGQWPDDEAFDDDYTAGSGWVVTKASLPAWIQVQVVSAITPVQFGIGGYTTASSTVARSARDFTLEGSNNGTDWTTLRSLQDITWSGHDFGTPKKFTLP